MTESCELGCIPQYTLQSCFVSDIGQPPSRNVQPTKDRGQFYCERCSMSFPSIDKLWTHKNEPLHIRKKHVCFVCMKGFVGPSKLQRHIRIHTNSRPFQCPICLKSFNQMSTLKTHQLTHAKTLNT